MSYQYTIDRILGVQEQLDRLIPSILHLMDCEGLDGEPMRQIDSTLSEITALRTLLREQAGELQDAINADLASA